VAIGQVMAALKAAYTAESNTNTIALISGFRTASP